MHRRGMSLMVCAAMAVATAVFAQAPQAPVPRLAPVAEAERTPEQQKVAAQFEASGMTHALGTFLHHAPLAQIVFAHERYLTSESTLAPRERLLLLLRTAWLSRSEYLWAHRAVAAGGHGFSAGDLTRIARGADAPGWTDFDRALLQAADDLHVDAFISDDTWRALSTRYDTKQLIDVVDTVGATIMHAGAFNSLGVRLEPGLTERFPSDVPYRPTATRTNIRLQGQEPRIPPPPPQRAADGTVRRTANVFATFRHNPEADAVRGAINTYVNGRTALDPKHVELLLMRIGILCRSEYEYAAHLRVGRRAGMTDAEVDSITRGPGSGQGPLWDALLQATDDLHARDRVSDEAWAVLAQAFTPRQLLETLIAVGGYRSTSLLLNSAGVQLDDDMADFRFPPELR
jgi:4-carboxymuconolactone decarboxylase